MPLRQSYAKSGVEHLAEVDMHDLEAHAAVVAKEDCLRTTKEPPAIQPREFGNLGNVAGYDDDTIPDLFLVHIKGPQRSSLVPAQILELENPDPVPNPNQTLGEIVEERTPNRISRGRIELTEEGDVEVQANVPILRMILIKSFTSYHRFLIHSLE